MKLILIFSLLIITALSQAQSPAKNVVIITIDGTRWQEIFKGADSTLLHNPGYVKDTSLMLQQYWHTDEAERRRRLLPFFWQVIAQDGQLLGNRELGNNVNVANLYKISYPGYSEIFTGYADKLFIPNLAINNPRMNILQWLNNQPDYHGKVAAFCSWRVFPFILDEKNGELPVNAGYESVDGIDSTSDVINDVQNGIFEKNNTRHDMLTFECAKNYLVQHHPRVLYIGFGETDEFAHHHNYDTYLQKIHQADAMIAELWYYLQTDSYYKNNTTVIITTDHGRGGKKGNWNSHGFWIKGSGQTWMALLGSGIPAEGESNKKDQAYQKQLAATVATLLGVQFTTKHHIGKTLAVGSAKEIKTVCANSSAIVSR